MATVNEKAPVHESARSPRTPSEDAGAAASSTAAAALPASGRGVGQGFPSLRLRDFRYLTLGTVVAGFGQWAQIVGLGWLVYVLTGSAVQLGSISAVRGLIGLAVAPGSGVLLDRIDRRQVLIVTTSLGAAKTAVLAALVVSGAVEVWHVYVFAVADGVITTVNMTARQAFVFDVTTDEALPNAVAVSSMAQNLSRVAGPPLTGAIIGLYGEGAPFVFITVMLTVAAALTARISRETRQVIRMREENPLRSLMEGVRYIATDERILGLMVVGIVPGLLIYPYISLLPIFAAEVLHRGASGYGVLSSMGGWGSLVGLLGLALLGDIRRKGAMLLSGLILYALIVIFFTQSTVYPLSLGLLALSGVFLSVALVLTNTLIQLHVRDDMRGRTLAVYQMTGGLSTIGALPMGAAVAWLGPSLGVGLFIVTATALLVLVAASWGSLRRA